MALPTVAGRTREVVGGAFDDALTKAEALLFGRRTWQSMAAAWPERPGDPFADRMNAIPKYVVSDTLGEAELTWDNTTRIPGDKAVARICELHEAEGGDLLVMGSPTLALVATVTSGTGVHVCTYRPVAER